MYIFKEPLEHSFTKAGVTGKIFSTHHLTDTIETLLIETEVGHDTVILQENSDFVYYVLQGKGVFIINDETRPCEQGDLVVIPKGQRFTYKGKLKMLLSIAPPWKEAQEKVFN